MAITIYDAKSVIYAQRFDTRGRKAGPVIHVTTPEPPPNQSKTEVSVSMDDDGAFAVAWLHRYFPDFPSAELDIDLEVAVFEPDGRVQESHVVLRHEDLPFGHGHKDTRIKKVAGYGYVVMTNHTTRPELEVGESISNKLYSSTFEGRFYPDGEAPSEIFSSDVFEVKGRSIFDLTIAASGKIGLVFEDIQSEVKVTRFAEINSDFTDVLSVQILNANGELSPQSEALPVIQAKPNGTYIYAVTGIPDDYVTTRRQFLRGGFIRPNHIVDDISKSLSFELVENKMFSIWFESTQGKTYRLLNGGELDALEEIEIIRGTGQRISRQYPFSLGFEFFAVTED